MSSLMAMLAQQSPTLQTRKGLILLGLQNDFLPPDGNPAVNSPGSAWTDRIKTLVADFRPHGHVIWVRSEFEADGSLSSPTEDADTITTGSGPIRPPSNDGDPADQKLSQTVDREPPCLPGTRGAAYADQIKHLIDKRQDLQMVKTKHSAFDTTSLLLTLRSKLITELYICGGYTNLSVHATAIDAARYGIRITLVEDCLGYAQKAKHVLAVQNLIEIMRPSVKTSVQVIDNLRNPSEEQDEQNQDEEDQDEEEEDQVEEDWSDEFVEFGEEAAKSDEISNSAYLLEVDSDTEGDEEAKFPWKNPYITSHGSKLELRCRQADQASSRSPATTPADAGHPLPFQEPGYESDEPRKIRCARDRSSEHRRTRHPGFDRRKRGDANRHATEPALIQRSSSYRGNGLVKSAGSDVVVKLHTAHNLPKGSNASRGSSSKVERIRRNQPWLDVIEPATSRALSSTPQSRPIHPGLAAMAKLGGLPSAIIAQYEEMMAKARQANATPEPTQSLQQKIEPLFGKQIDGVHAHSRILQNLFPESEAQTILDELKHEVNWQTMYHQTGMVPRLVCCQGTIDPNGTVPVYRHPSDQTIALQGWTPSVEKIRQAAEQAVGHELNHVLIQLYRNGSDYISEHTDKTLDIAPASSIVNVSFGAQRTMRFRTKKRATTTTDSSPKRTTHRIPLPHNSMLTLSLATNAEYLHGINADKRPRVELTDAETAYDGQRISLTFRRIATFLTPADSLEPATSAEKTWLIFGQGATGKTRVEARPVINGNEVESEKLVRAFGRENQSAEGDGFDWRAIYGEGSDVLHLK